MLKFGGSSRFIPGLTVWILNKKPNLFIKDY